MSELCEANILLEIEAQVESLNVAIAGSILMYLIKFGK
ncbi:hypothetical protein [Spiroplasma clarkii]